MPSPYAAAVIACRLAGLDASAAELIRAGENTLYRLPGHVIARVSRLGQLNAAAKEVQVSRWLQAQRVPVVEAINDIEQPVAVNDRAVTFWRELPPHRYSTTTELATALRQLHALPAPPFRLPPIAPFVRQRERIIEATTLANTDRQWLLDHLARLETKYTALPPGMPWCAVHGDAWAGNIAVTDSGPVPLDLERFGYGPPEWDLTSIAVDYTTFGDLSAADWQGFCDRYGHDVTTWDGFTILRDARELRKVTFALQMAAQQPSLTDQAAYRLACIQGRHGPRPWGWAGVG